MSAITSIKNREFFISRRQLFTIAFMVICAFFLFGSIAKAKSNRQTYTYYCSYEIQPGDTLWTIANKYVIEDGQDKEEFISTVKSINHMLDDDLNTGDYIVIAYDSYEVK